MARPLKKGLGYFPLDTRFLSNRKIQRLAQRYGCKGICIYIATLCEVYGEKGYYAHFNRDFCFDIGFTTGLEDTFVEEVILFCAQIKLFDKCLLEQEQVLTSKGIQLRFEEIYKRTKVQIEERFNLLPSKEVSATETPVNATKNLVNVTETPVFAAKTPTKGKGKGKGKEKEKGNKNTTLKSGLHENRNSTDNGEAARRAELLRMAAEATSGC